MVVVCVENHDIELKLALVEKQVEENTKLIQELKISQEERIKLTLQVESLTKTVEELNITIHTLQEKLSVLETQPGQLAIKGWQYVLSLIISGGLGALLNTLASIL